MNPSPSSRRPRVFYGWYIVAASVAMNLLMSVVYFQGFQAFFLPILHELGWSRTLLSGAFSLRQLENGVASPIVGWMVDRWGARKIILTGVIIGALGMSALSRVSDPILFYLCFAIISAGMSGPGHSISWAAAVTNWFRRLRGRALALAFMGPVLGGPFLYLVVLLEQAVGWRTATLWLSVLLLLAGIPLALVARHRPEDYGLLPDGDIIPTSPPAAQRVPQAVAGIVLSEAKNLEGGQGGLIPRPSYLIPAEEGWTVKQAARTRAFWVLVAIFAVQGLCHSGMMAHQLPLFQSLGFTAGEGAIGLGLIFFLSAFGRIAAGFLTDYLDRRLVLGFVIVLHAAAFAWLARISPEWWQILVFTFLYGVAFGSAIPARPLIVRELFGSRAFSTINGLTQGANFSAGVLGPLVMGIAFDLMGTYTPGVWVFAGLMLASLPLVLLLRTPTHPA